MRKLHKGFKRGAASFYIVAFSTLILVVIATSFATVIMSEISRTANDDLSQSAYDSALAGTEDAKVAYANYRKCKENGATAQNPSSNSGITCGNIVWWVEHDYGSNEKAKCAMVGHILGKIDKDYPNNSVQNPEVMVGGTVTTGKGGKSGDEVSTTNQSYTCAIINTDLKDYRTTLSENKNVQTLRASMGTGPTNAADIIKISWYSVARFKDSLGYSYANINNSLSSFATPFSTDRVVFPKSSSAVLAPPIVELQIVQTGESFSLSQFDEVGSNQTNRATLFLAPTGYTSIAGSGEKDGYIGVWNGTKNVVSASDVVKTNDRIVKNKAFAVYCNPNTDTEFYCNAEIKLPGVIRGNRNNNTFMISFSLPYQQPKTDFSIELCDNSGNCDSPIKQNELKETGKESSQKKITNVQISLDVTGRANDLYRRVETRLESEDTTFGKGYPYYALEVLGNEGLEKKLDASSEYNFYIGNF